MQGAELDWPTQEEHKTPRGPSNLYSFISHHPSAFSKVCDSYRLSAHSRENALWTELDCLFVYLSTRLPIHPSLPAARPLAADDCFDPAERALHKPEFRENFCESFPHFSSLKELVP